MILQSADAIGLTVANHDAQDAATVYVGKAATLALTLTNNSGAPIPLASTGAASTLTLFLPRFYTTDQVQAMTVAATDWTAVLSGKSWVLTYAGASAAWADGATIRITVGKTVATAQPTSGFLQINPKNMGTNVPVQVSATITLNTPPEPGNADLTKVLAVSLDNQGSVYVSTASSGQGPLKTDALPNTLFLNLKNLGDKPIYQGSPGGVGTPKINVSFVYGSTAGALANNNDPNVDPKGSAWLITAGAAVSNLWQPINPTYSDEQPDPVWVLKPTNTNFTIIGTGDQANVTFSFANIVSFTPPGHTQMVVQCTGFKQTDTRLYDDCTFVIDISKQLPPPTRGLLNFFAPQPLFTVYDPDTTSKVDLQWTMFDVPSVLLMTNIPQIAPRPITYPKFTPLAYDHLSITVPGVTQSTAVFFTMQAFDGLGNYLNSLQFTAYIQAYMFVDPRDSQVYPAILVGRTLWMAHNLNYMSANSQFFGGNPTNGPQYGRLYTAQDAASMPKGWRLPSDADWQALIAAFGGIRAAYAALIAGGPSGFQGQLGGYCDNFGNYSELGQFGYYWSSTQNSANPAWVDYAQFVPGSVSTGAAYPPNFLVSVRYVRDLQ